MATITGFTLVITPSPPSPNVKITYTYTLTCTAVETAACEVFSMFVSLWGEDPGSDESLGTALDPHTVQCPGGTVIVRTFEFPQSLLNEDTSRKYGQDEVYAKLDGTGARSGTKVSATSNVVKGYF